MTNTKKLSLITLLAAATALPSIAAADHDDRYESRWMKIGDVGTHRHDAEDYVPVRGGERLDRIALRAHGRAVAVDEVQIQYADGTKEYARVGRWIEPGQDFVIDVRDGRRIEMLVLDYGNRGPFFRDREDARVEVFGMEASSGRRDRDYRDRDYRRDRDRDYRAPRPTRVVPAPNDTRAPYYYDNTGVRWELRGGAYIRVR